MLVQVQQTMCGVYAGAGAADKVWRLCWCRCSRQGVACMLVHLQQTGTGVHAGAGAADRVWLEFWCICSRQGLAFMLAQVQPTWLARLPVQVQHAGQGVAWMLMQVQQTSCDMYAGAGAGVLVGDRGRYVYSINAEFMCTESDKDAYFLALL
jgi:hypothetical protein